MSALLRVVRVATEVRLQIKSLQVQGFKSFVDKVVFDFQPGITAIVGPNGCGKSNVVDAVRWAMGEQSPRRLRGKGMEDVIFAGSDSRSALGMAEVILTFDNSAGSAPAAWSQYSEIQVARRLYRSGESEYLINKVPTRLRDVLDFFRDTGIGTRGYTIVEQGQIAQVVSAKAEERRSLIEEAAGISKYKARRRESERRLEATEQNLLRVSDVLAEIKRQISSIERQARKAARYKRLREGLRQLDLSLAADDRRGLLEEVEVARQQGISLRDEAVAAEAQAAERDTTLERLRIGLTEREKHLGAGSETLFELRGRVREFENAIAYERRERSSLGEASSNRVAEIERLREQRQTAEAELREIELELEPLQASLASDTDKLSVAETEARAAEKELRSLEGEREAANAALIDTLTRVARIEDREGHFEERVPEIARRLRAADEALEVHQLESGEAERERAQLERGLRSLLAERDRLMVGLREALVGHETMEAAVQSAVEEAESARQRCETRRARMQSLRELIDQHEELSAGARHLVEGGDELRRSIGLRAMVHEVFDVESGFEVAVDAVLAERAGALIVERPEDALAALQSLREAEAGRAVLLAKPGLDVTPVGFVPLGDPILEHVRVRPGYEATAQMLLGGVNLVSDLSEVLSVYPGRPPATFVTRAGDVLGADGTVRGGSRGEGGGFLARRRELEGLGTEVDELDSQVRECEARLRRTRQELTRSNEELENLRNRYHTAALAVANHEKDLERARERSKALSEAQERRCEDRSALLSESESLTTDLEGLHRELAEAKRERADRQRSIDALGLRIGSAMREVSRLQGVLGERRVEHTGRAELCERLGNARDRTHAAREETSRWIERLEQESRDAEARRAVLAQSIETAEQALSETLAEEERARVNHGERRDGFERASAEVRELEERVRALRSELGSKREALSQAELAQRETELRLSHLDETVRDRWQVELSSWRPSDSAAEAPAAGDAGEPEDGGAADEVARTGAEVAALPREERERLVREARSKLESLGEVNLSAIDEHEELGERFRFLSEQKTDLEGSVAQLREAIGRINRTSRRRFRETFDAVNACFKEIFPRLFRGGKAGLSLTDSEDVLEAGIDIMAQPPGKRLQNVNLLSGGEKTLTALALLISVFQVRPSPFFLLDEVDAALDDANVGRFNDIVKEMSKESQFLVITHNKRTIEIADVLYGVTMEEKGVSKLVSVSFH